MYEELLVSFFISHSSWETTFRTLLLAANKAVDSPASTCQTACEKQYSQERSRPAMGIGALLGHKLCCLLFPPRSVLSQRESIALSPTLAREEVSEHSAS